VALLSYLEILQLGIAGLCDLVFGPRTSCSSWYSFSCFCFSKLVALLFYLEILQLGIAGLCDLALWTEELPQLLAQLLLFVQISVVTFLP
jgi:hypothetical protein